MYQVWYRVYYQGSKVRSQVWYQRSQVLVKGWGYPPFTGTVLLHLALTG